MEGQAAAHCDTLDGPVVADARTALAQGNVAPVLKWVRPADEKEIRTAFARTTAVRNLSPEAEILADLYFFEALVRIHRAGEGAPLPVFIEISVWLKMIPLTSAVVARVALPETCQKMFLAWTPPARVIMAEFRGLATKQMCSRKT